MSETMVTDFRTVELTEIEMTDISEMIKKNPRAAVETLFDKIGADKSNLGQWQMPSGMYYVSASTVGWPDMNGGILRGSNRTVVGAWVSYADRLMEEGRVIQICNKGALHTDTHVELKRPQPQTKVKESLQAVA